jgi:GT2 family glycosyltransferase
MEQSEHRNDAKDLPFVVIISVNWNGWRDTLECLESVQRLDYPNYLMIVVDNASRDDSLARIREWAEKREGYVLVEYPEAVARVGGEVVQEQALTAALPASRAVLIRSAENIALTGGANLAIDYALRRDQPVDYVFLLDNDAKAEKHTLTHLVEVARKENAGIVGGVILDWKTGQIQYAERTTLLRWFFCPLVKADLPLPAKEVDYWPSAGVSGGAMLIRRDVLDTLYAATGHHIPSDLFRAGWEFELCYRSSLAGYRSFVSRGGFVWHKGWRSAGCPVSPRHDYYFVRNRMEMADAFLPFGWRVLFHICNLPLTLARVLRALRYRRPDAVRAIVDGLMDGYQGVKGKWKHHDDREGVQATFSPRGS